MKAVVSSPAISIVMRLDMIVASENRSPCSSTAMTIDSRSSPAGSHGRSRPRAARASAPEIAEPLAHGSERAVQPAVARGA